MCPDSKTHLEGAFYQSSGLNTSFWSKRSVCVHMRDFVFIELAREKLWASDLVYPLRYT